MKIEVSECTVNGTPAIFHCWEHYFKPLPASLLQGGEPAGVFSKVFGIVEIDGEIRRADPTEIAFDRSDASAAERQVTGKLN